MCRRYIKREQILFFVCWSPFQKKAKEKNVRVLLSPENELIHLKLYGEALFLMAHSFVFYISS